MGNTVMEQKEMVDATCGTAEATQEKTKNIFVRLYDGGRRFVIRAKATKGGRVVIGMTKAAALGLGAWKLGDFCYKRGQASVTPSVVTITAGVPEVTVEIPEETPAETEEVNVDIVEEQNND